MSEKRSIEQEREQEKSDVVDTELHGRSEELERARAQVERERVQKEAEVTRNVEASEPNILGATKTMNSYK